MPDGESGRAAQAKPMTQLEELLRRKRSDRAQKEVEGVLASAASSGEKIRLIQEIDRRSPPSREQRHRKQRYIGTTEAAHQGIHVRARRPPRVVRQQVRQRLFPYLFRERARIREFGYRSRTVTASVVPATVRLTPDVPGFVLGFLRPTARDIAAMITQLVGNAWMHLDKADFNLLVLVLDLCEAIDQLPTNSEEYRGPEAFDRLKGIEQRLLAIRYGRDAVDRVVDAMQLLISNNRRAIDKLNALPRITRRLIGYTEERPSLMDVILAINMCKFRRHFTEEDLVVPGLGEVVEQEVFDCSESVHERIDEYIERIVRQLEALEEERRQVLRLRAFLKRGDQEEVDTQLLGMLIDGAGGRTTRSAEENAAGIALASLPRLVSLLLTLFHKPVTLSGVGTRILFDGLPFDGEISRLRRAEEQIQVHSRDLPYIQKERFLALADRRETATTAEADFLMQIQIAQDAMKSIRDVLQRVLGIDSSLKNAESVSKYLPLHDGDSLPFESNITKGPRIIYGSTLRAAFSRVVEVLYILAYLFGDRSVRHHVAREHHIDSDIEHLLDTIDRIAEPERAQLIINRFTGS